MKLAIRRQGVTGSWILVLPFLVGSAGGAAPSAEQALKLLPIQRDVEFDRPSAEQSGKCHISARRIGDLVGWVIEDPNGLTLRKFIDTNGDNVVDRWSYYKDGLEVYRDIDSDFNGKADQYRWFHTAGSRWGVDKDQNGTIDFWKAISAEETAAEVIAALANRDGGRFGRLVVTAEELRSLGLGSEKAGQLAEKISGLEAKFAALATRQKEVTGTTEWVQFGGNRPGVVPAGTDGSTKDFRVYENVVAIVQTGNQHGQVLIGTLIEVGDVWRVIELPRPLSEAAGGLAASGFFFQSSTAPSTNVATAGPSEEVQKLLADLEALDKAAGQATSPQDQARFNAQRADLLEQIAEAGNRADRAMWLRQLADMVSAAVQSEGYPDGPRRLERLLEKLEKNEQDGELAAYVKFRQLQADYGLSLQDPQADFVKIQTEWLKKLEQYATDYPNSPDTAEAMLQLAMAQEFAGQEEEAKRWYGRIVKEFSTSPVAKKAAGARTRLDSVGKPIGLQGKSPSGGVVDLAKYRGNVVLIQYWASWCEPCKADMGTLKQLLTRYGRLGFSIIGVNLDSSAEEMASFLAQNRLAWPQIYEEGGLDSRPANELGILTLPTMILVDQQGRVVNRNINVAELDGELKKIIR